MVGLGNTAKKLQQMLDTAEELYAKLNDLKAEVQQLREKLDTTSETVTDLDRELAEQRAILEAVAEDADVDVAQVVADADTETVTADRDADATEGVETGDPAGGSAAEPEE